MNRFIRRRAALLPALAAALALAAPASAQETFKLGIVTFLSGPAADSFGVPARNGCQFVIDQLNKGAAPSPYEKVGFGGLKIEPVIIDENGGATKQVQEMRNLYQRDNVDAVLGYIGSFPIPEVIMGINATILGAQTVNPNIKVKIIWANTWFDPGKEADAAKALLDQGADVIMQHTDSPAAMQIASERGKLAFGQDSEMIKFGPKSQLTSIMDNWGPYYIARVKAELEGTWKSEDEWGGLKSKMVVMAPYTNMPDDVKKLAMDTEAGITEGKLQPFKCPIIGQDGKEVECKGGTHLDDGQVLGMNFYVKGVDDKIPGK